MKKIITVLLSLSILAAGGLVMPALIKRAPKPPKAEPEPVIPGVEVIHAVSADHPLALETHGIVIPARQVTLKSQVSGEIIGLHEDLVQGGVVKQGQTLLQIDTADYLLNVTQSKEAVAGAQYQLDLEMGRQTIAAEEWQIFGDSVPNSQEGKDLALRKPHLASAEASLEAARSRLDKAKLDLERTKVAAPFNAVVLNEQVETGQVISAGAGLATLVDSDTFWVKASVPYKHLSRLSFPDEAGGGGSPAEVRVQGSESGRPGRVVRMLPDLEESGRMARVLVRVDRPLEQNAGQLPLLLDAYVEVIIQGGLLHDVVSVPHEALHTGEAGDQIRVMTDQDTLGIRPVTVTWKNDSHAFVSQGLKSGDRIITSRISVPLEGMKLKAVNEQLARDVRGE
ncbi:MAG: efflux RND transporter periplasmic adaptor subunit [Acidobacteriota bacterium]|nr:efflux RND transporter periplasmic adaptor subunit [Acidobacteriota bacterium]